MGECEALENYLKQILILLETKGYARSKDIADSMGVSKAEAERLHHDEQSKSCLSDRQGLFDCQAVL